jgi:hypothetical protein
MGWVYVGGEMWGAVLDLQHAGIINEHEAIRITIPTAQRSLDDIRMPFRDTGKFAGLAIEHLELMAGPDPFWEELQRTGDKSAFARGLAGMVRGFGGPTIAGALYQDRDRAAVIDAYFRRLEERFATNPQRTRVLPGVRPFGKNKVTLTTSDQDSLARDGTGQTTASCCLKQSPLRRKGARVPKLQSDAERYRLQ